MGGVSLSASENLQRKEQLVRILRQRNFLLEVMERAFVLAATVKQPDYDEVLQRVIAQGGRWYRYVAGNMTRRQSQAL